MKSVFIIILVSICYTFSAGIVFTFENSMVTGPDPLYYEFDIYVNSDEEGTYLGDAMVYLNYSEPGFGNSVYNNEKIIVTKGELLDGEITPGFPLYEVTNIYDNTTTKVAITTGYLYSGSPTEANTLSTSPKRFIHIALEIADSSTSSALSFDALLMRRNQYYSDNVHKYLQVIADDIDDSPLSYIPSSIELARHGQIPKEFQINQNYPNPFNPDTEFEIGIPLKNSSHQTKVFIFNILGQKIKELVNAKLNAGYYTIKWDGKNEQGQLMPSGLYFYIIRNSNFMDKKKMILMK